METLKLPGPKARALVERDQAVISPSYPRGYPFVMDHGLGSEVWDVDGNRFLDFAAGIAVTSTGHSHPKVVRAIQEHQKWVELGEKLNQISPFDEPAISFMTNSGTESVEAAIKLARYTTERTEFIGFLGGFHGRTMGAVTFTASKSSYHRGFYPMMSGVVHAPFPDPYHPILQSEPGEDYGETVVRYIEEQILGRIVPADDVAGILLEPIQGEGGYCSPTGFFPCSKKIL
jgi:4-aminobutyrate aminotransferase